MLFQVRMPKSFLQFIFTKITVIFLKLKKLDIRTYSLSLIIPITISLQIVSTEVTTIFIQI